MGHKATLALLLACLLGSTTAYTQEKPGAVLLIPESDMDRELADDLTEVLISSLIDKSGKVFRIEGKESFRKTLLDRKTDDGSVCLTAMECVRTAGKEAGLELLVFGKVGKAMGGYRLEVWRLSMTQAPDRPPYRKRVAGDIGKLIEEVELLAEWALAPDKAILTIEVEPQAASLVLDGKPITGDTRTFDVTPGEHKVEAVHQDHEPQTVTVACVHGQTCTAKLKLKNAAAVTPDKPPVEPPDGGEPEKKTAPGRISSAGIAAASVLCGVALLSGGGGIFMYSKMKTAETDANNYIADYSEKYCKDNICKTTAGHFDEGMDPIVERGERSALWANILGGAAVAAAVGAGAVLVVDYLSPPEAEGATTSFVPLLGPAGTGFTFQVEF